MPFEKLIARIITVSPPTELPIIPISVTQTDDPGNNTNHLLSIECRVVWFLLASYILSGSLVCWENLHSYSGTLLNRARR